MCLSVCRVSLSIFLNGGALRWSAVSKHLTYIHICVFFIIIFWIFLWDNVRSNNNRWMINIASVASVPLSLYIHIHIHIIYINNYSFNGLVLRPYLFQLILIKDQCTMVAWHFKSYRVCHTNWSTFTLLFLIWFYFGNWRINDSFDALSIKCTDWFSTPYIAYMQYMYIWSI